MVPSFSEMFFAHGGRVSDKWEQYLSVYDRELAKFIAAGKPVQLLEIGVQNGGSLEIWSELLPSGSTIIGLDIDPKCGELTFNASNIRVAIADASSKTELDAALGDLHFDIILDDGSHRSEHVIATFIACFPRLLDGGIYIVEDLHTSYWPEFGGGFRDPQSSIEWLKSLVDAEHADYFRGAVDINDAGFLSDMNKYVRRVAFYDSVCVIEKYARPKEQPHKRVLTGSVASVMDPVLLAGLEGPGLGESLMLTAKTLDSTVESLKKNNDRLVTELENEQNRLTQSDTARREAERKAQILSERVQDLESQLTTIQQSTFWRATRPLRGFLSRHPQIARVGRRCVKFVWWLVTGQLRKRYDAYQISRQSRHVSKKLDGDQGAIPSSYDRMKQKITQQRESRSMDAAVTGPSFTTLSEIELSEVLAGVKFAHHEQPVVSIIIPVFNQIRLTTECLLSIAKNTGETVTVEVIVSDDASTDLTSELLSKVEGLVYRRNTANLHFVRNCNAAATLARGKYILFLNNDVQVTSGWLEPLVSALESDPTLGAAGPRIVYPSGHLQEAGVIVTSSGQSKLIGLGEDPNNPCYHYAHSVDYCSGAALLVRKDLFQKLGGFWEELAPAYCEDLELCLRFAEAGFSTFYVPESLVIHHMSQTTTADGSTAKMQMIIRNQQKLVERWQSRIDELNHIRLFAFYLPQFHTFPENDQWWGKGFTEWTNVTRAKPMYVGHQQPQLPADLGFYDLRRPEIMEAQAELAQRYGIEGFCFYYYWFNGKRLLEAPLEQMLSSGKPDFPFMLCWANENWSRRWDGQDQDVLIAQNHSPEDDEAVIADLMRYMRDSRYARVDGKPILLIYRVDLFPDFRATAERWRRSCREAGLGEIFLAAVESMQLGAEGMHPTAYGCDASVQFPPHGQPVPADMRGRGVAANFKGQVYDYEQSALSFVGKQPSDRPWYPCVMPGWDNTARRMERASIFDGASPGAFQAWLEEAMRQTHEHNSPGQRFVFINAWNEWAEGAQLEPDQINGHARLEAVRNALLSRLRSDEDTK